MSSSLTAIQQQLTFTATGKVEQYEPSDLRYKMPQRVIHTASLWFLFVSRNQQQSFT